VARRLRPVIVVLALSEAGYIALDGIRALIAGDYITPGSGRFAGQLGPWSALVSAVGIEPRSTLMKGIFAAYGLIWLLVILAYGFGVRWAWRAMVLAAVLSLWYFPLGTVISLLVLGLLVVQRRDVAT
jgi:hypothetical protein